MYIPAEWAPQSAIWVGFPSHHALWPGDLLAQAQQEVATLCNYLAETQTCYVWVANQASMLAAQRLITEQANIVLFPFGDIWFRDISPIFKHAQQAICVQHNGWGGKYCYPYDDCAAARLVEYFSIDAQTMNFVLEGGALEHNGEGAILTTRQCLLNKNRNGWDTNQAEAQLTKALNAHTFYWLDEGVAYDHTDGHIDNNARFVAAKAVISQHANGSDDPNKTLFRKQKEELLQQQLTVTTVPSPGLIKNTHNETMPASHANFVISNEFIIFPHYLKQSFTDKKCVDETKETLARLFPDREIIAAPSNAILTGGGSFHCISQHIPLSQDICQNTSS